MKFVECWLRCEAALTGTPPTSHSTVCALRPTLSQCLPSSPDRRKKSPRRKANTLLSQPPK
eukprot:6900619-Pyramimonas_sp.AAC.1